MVICRRHFVSLVYNINYLFKATILISSSPSLLTVKPASQIIWPTDQPPSTDPIEQVEIEAVFSKATQVIAWHELQNNLVWRQGVGLRQR